MGFSFVFGETNWMRPTVKRRADAAGLSRDLLASLKTRHYIGRQAPVKRCLARFAGIAPRSVATQLWWNGVEDCAEIQRKT
jgi:hypothetical protein